MNPASFTRHSGSRHRRAEAWVCLIALGLALAGVDSVCARQWQIGFDADGNLQTQTAESLGPPQILSQPQLQIVVPGELASFLVVAFDTRGLTYQWLLNGSNLAAATTETLLITNASSANEGQYAVVLVNGSGSVTSAPAALMLDSDADGLPDSWELAYFGNLNQTATGDFDGDGISNLQEFLDGTNPTNSASVLYRYQLVVVNDGGTVTLTPNQRSYTNGQVVTLTASPSELFHAWTGDVVTRSNPVTVVMTTNKTIMARFTPIAIAWTNLAGGDWNAATNWTPNLVPATNDIASITNSPAVVVNTNTESGSLLLGAAGAGPTLTGPGTLTVYGTSFWAYASFSGSGRTVIAPDATLTIANASSMYMTTRAFENGGTVLWTGTGPLVLFSGVTLTNRAGALFNVQNSAVFLYGSGAASRFDNAGIFRKSVNPGTTSFNTGVPFNNYGSMELQSGMLLFSDTFTNRGAVIISSGATNRVTAGGSTTGSFAVLSNAVMEWYGGTYTFDAGAQLSGDGLYRVTSGTLTCNADLSIQNLDVTSTFAGTGTVTIGGLMNWNGILGGSGRTIISPGATLATSSGTYLDSRVLENAGTILWTGASYIIIQSGAVLTNDAGGLINAQNTATLLSGFGGGRFDNAGTFRKSVNPGTTTTDPGVAVSNYGFLDIQTGTLVCNGPFINNGSVNVAPGSTNRLAGNGSGNGSFTAAPNALVEWTGAFTLNPGAQLNGNGLYRVTSGTLTCNADLAIQNLDVISTFAGTGTVTIGGLMNWSGFLSGSGRTIISPGATLATSSGTYLDSRVLENAGTILWTGTGYINIQSGAVLTNRPGGLFNVQNAAIMLSGFGGGRLDNAGILRKSLNPGTTTLDTGVALNNYGTVDLRSGILSASGGYNSSSGSVLNCAIGGTGAGTNYAQLQAAGEVTLNGALSVVLTNGYLPTTNDSFTVLTAGSRSGAFASFIYPSNQITMQLSNTANSVVVRVTAVAPRQPLLLTPVLLGSNVILAWTAISNTTYRLEFKPDPHSGIWSAISGDVIAASNTAFKLDPLTSSNRFYRVHVLP